VRDLDYQLLKRLQAELGRVRQAEVLRRRAANLPALMGEDAHQHGKALVQRVVGDYESALAESGEGGLVWETRQDLVEALEARLFGAGSLQLLLDDESVENIDINGFSDVFVEYADGTTAKVRPIAASNEELIETIQTLAAHGQRAGQPAPARWVSALRGPVSHPSTGGIHPQAPAQPCGPQGPNQAGHPR
jgi:pilus assembly protein CpaF